MRSMTWWQKRGANTGVSMFDPIQKGDGTLARYLEAGKCPKCKTILPEPEEGQKYIQCIVCGLQISKDT